MDDGHGKGKGEGMRLHLTAFDKKRKVPVQASQTSTTRNSRLEETVNAPEPNFNEATSKRGQLRRFSSIEETYAVPEADFNLAPPTVGVHWDN